MSLITDALIEARRERGTNTERPFIEDCGLYSDTLPQPRRPVRAAAGAGASLLVVFVVALAWRGRVTNSNDAHAPSTTEPVVTLQSKSEAPSERVARETPEQGTPAFVTPKAQPIVRQRAGLGHLANANSVSRETAADISVASDSEATTGTRVSSRVAADSLFRLAYVEQMNRHLDGAKSLYEQAIATGSASAAAYNDYGVLLLTRGARPAASAMFREALNHDDRSVEAWVNLCDLFNDAGQQSEAMSAYSRANRLDPARVAIRLRLARGFEAIGDMSSARRYLEGAPDVGADDDSLLAVARRRIERLTRTP